MLEVEKNYHNLEIYLSAARQREDKLAARKGSDRTRSQSTINNQQLADWRIANS